jgi:hypothetical protein
VAASQPIAQVRLLVTWVDAPAAVMVSAVTSYHSSASYITTWTVDIQPARQPVWRQ